MSHIHILCCSRGGHRGGGMGFCHSSTPWPSPWGIENRILWGQNAEKSDIWPSVAFTLFALKLFLYCNILWNWKPNEVLVFNFKRPHSKIIVFIICWYFQWFSDNCRINTETVYIALCPPLCCGLLNDDHAHFLLHIFLSWYSWFHIKGSFRVH